MPGHYFLQSESTIIRTICTIMPCESEWLNSYEREPVTCQISNFIHNKQALVFYLKIWRAAQFNLTARWYLYQVRCIWPPVV